MDKVEKLVSVIFGGVILIALVSVFVGRNAKTPEVIQASGSFIANIVAAAVAPVNTAATNGNLGANPFTHAAQ